MAQVINFKDFKKNELNFTHVICAVCGGNLFHIEVDTTSDEPLFKFLICKKCDSAIPVNMTPVWNNDNRA